MLFKRGHKIGHNLGCDLLSLPKIPSEPELERLQEIAIELMGLSGTGCDLNHKQRTSTIEIAPPILRSSDDGYRPPRNDWRAGIRNESGGEAFVAMMQAADLSNGDYLSDPGWHDRARVRTILVERKMSPSSMVVIDIRGQDAAQMALVED